MHACKQICISEFLICKVHTVFINIDRKSAYIWLLLALGLDEEDLCVKFIFFPLVCKDFKKLQL